MNEIDVTNPAVKRLLQGGHDQRAEIDLATGNRGKNLVHMAGDMDTGMSRTTYLDRGKHEVLVHYRAREMFLTVDVYALPDEPMRIHLICPQCCKALQITQDRKAISWEPDAVNPLARGVLADPPRGLGAEDLAYLHERGSLGALSVETFECTWELPKSHELCRWRAAIDKNVAKDA